MRKKRKNRNFKVSVFMARPIHFDVSEPKINRTKCRNPFGFR